MSKILLPNQPDLSGKPKPPKIKATVVFQDTNYTIMRNKETITQDDVFNLPLHLILIGCGMLDARTYVPKTGKEGFLKVIKNLKKSFDENYHKQKAIANNLSDPVKPKVGKK